MDLTEIKAALQEAISNPGLGCECVSPMVRLLMERTEAGETITVGDLARAAVDAGKDIQHGRHCVGGWIVRDGQHCPHVAETRVRIGLMLEGERIFLEDPNAVYDDFIDGSFDAHEVAMTSPVVRYRETDDGNSMIVEAELSGKKATVMWDGASAPVLTVYGTAETCTDYTDIANVAIEAACWINTMGDIVCPHQHES